MKKLILTIMIFTSFQGFAGQDGGGGDGVIRNGELVIRDLMNNNLKPVEDNVFFLKGISGFNKLIKEISKASPEFALSIVRDLTNANIYVSPENLPLLPYHQTTIVGIGADIQFAIRYGDDIILSPQFFRLKDRYKKYLLVHEAMHGVWPNGSGPAHHQRIREVVNYLYKNEGKLNAETLNKLVDQSSYSIDRIMNEYIWDESVERTARCLMTSAYMHQDLFGDVYRLAGLDCKFLEETKYMNYSDMMKLLNNQYPGIEDLSRILSYEDSFSRDLDELNSAKYNFQNPRKLNKNQKIRQTSFCSRQKFDRKKLLESNNQINAAQTALAQVKLKLPSKAANDFIRAIDSRNTSLKSDLVQTEETFAKYSIQVKALLAISEENNRACNEYYPEKTKK